VEDDDFRAFVNARWPALVATAYLVTADRGVAEDCTQEALAKVHRRWARVRDGSPAGYAHRAVVNAALSWRRRRRVAEVPLAPGFDRPAAGGDPDGVDPVLVAALRSLPPRMRAVVVLRYLEDLSEAETADLLGCSVGTVKSAGHRGVARLREALTAGTAATAQAATAVDKAPGGTPVRGGTTS
jgi:RNA polymerase sigma-70 factor (sigma-E family)